MTTLTSDDRRRVLTALREVVVVAVVRAPSPTSALLAVDALVAGGVVGIELTYTTPGAAEAIAAAADRYGDAIVLGAGTITTPAQAAEAVAAGATYLVSPGLRTGLAEAMGATGAALLLGALTPSEVMAATAAGADLVKLFPASLGGPGYLRSLRGPFPDVPFCPTGGVSPDTMAAWLDAGAAAVGAGSDLVSPARIASADWAGITEAARAFARAAARR